MANEVLYSGLGDLSVAAALHRQIEVLHADRASLMNHPAIRYYGDIAGTGSDAGKVSLAGLAGYDRMGAVAEGSSTSNTALTDASTTITVARQALQRQVSDLAGMTDAMGLVPALAADAVGSAEMRFTELVAELVGDFTSSVGSTGVDLSVDNFFDAIFTLTQASVGGPLLAVLYPTQVPDRQNSIRAEAGGLQFMASTQDMLLAKGQGFAGSFAGVDIFASSLVPANPAADSDGGMFGHGAIGYKDGTPAPILGAGGLRYDAGTKIFTEFERDSAAGLTKLVYNYYVGVAIIEDGRGCAITTDR